jgi:hypothetical protein
MGTMETKQIIKDICHVIVKELNLKKTPEYLYNLGIGEIVSVISRIISRYHKYHELGPWTNATFDGSAGPEIINLTISTLQFCGQLYTLGGPYGTVPVRLDISKELNSIQYNIKIDSLSHDWKILNESKRWKTIYLMCCNELTGNWEWAYQATGSFELNL